MFSLGAPEHFTKLNLRQLSQYKMGGDLGFIYKRALKCLTSKSGEYLVGSEGMSVRKVL